MDELRSSVTSGRCFVGLYGLNRSLRWTWRSLKRNFIEPLYSVGLRPVVACHFHVPEVISSIRSGELGAPVRDRGHHNLPVTAIWQEPQWLELLPPGLRALTKPMFDADSEEICQSRRNLLFQLRSLSQLWSMLCTLGANESDIFFLLRPDLQYLDELSVDQVLEPLTSGQVDVITSDWHQWGGLNDRFAFCSWRGARAIATRIELAQQFALEHGHLHAEKLLHATVVSHGLRHRLTSLRAMRVRADGFTLREGFDLDRGTGLSVSVRNKVALLRRSLR